MTKFSITKNGRPLSKKLYNWDEKTKTFSTDVDGLALDFTGVSGVTFNIGYNCTFKTDSYCIFKTESYCIFKTESDCTFITGSYCTFDTGSYCTFKTDSDCTFNTGSYCTFDTNFRCTFNTGYSCAFKTNDSCTFKVEENCCLIRYDVEGVTKIPTGKKIQLNGYETAGYTVIKEKKEVPTCNGKVVEIDGKKYKLVEGKE
jgi:hypothetical protein